MEVGNRKKEMPKAIVSLICLLVVLLTSELFGEQWVNTEFMIDTTNVNDAQNTPSVAFDGTNYFVVWESSFESDIYGIRVTSDETSIYPHTNITGVTPYPIWHRNPVIQFGAMNFLVVWERHPDRHINAKRVNSNGVPLDANCIPVANWGSRQYDPSVSWDENNWMAVYTYLNSGYYWATDIYVTRVTPAGDVIDPSGISVTFLPAYQRSPSIAFDGNNFLVVWEDRFLGGGSPYDIYGAYVSPDGQVSSHFNICSQASSQRHPRIGFDGQNYLVLWQDIRNGNWDIYGSFVNPSCGILNRDEIVISTAINDQIHPVITFDGTNYIAVWEDYRNGSNSDIFGATISTSGEILDEFSVSTADSNQQNVDIVHGPLDQCLIVYEGFTSLPYNTNRIWGVLVGEIGVEEGNFAHETNRTLRCFPNPFSLTTTIEYSVSKSVNVSLKVYDVRGSLIRSLTEKRHVPGCYKIYWDGRNNEDQEVKAGIYFIKINKLQSMKLIKFHPSMQIY